MRNIARRWVEQPLRPPEEAAGTLFLPPLPAGSRPGEGRDERREDAGEANAPAESMPTAVAQATPPGAPHAEVEALQHQLQALESHHAVAQRELEALLQTVRAQLSAYLWEVQRITGDLRAQLEKEVGERDEIIRHLQAQLEAQVGERDGIIRHLQTQLEAQVGMRDQLIRDMQAQLHQQTSLSSEQGQRIQNLQAELEAIRSSTFWQVMSFYWALRKRLPH